MQTIPLTPIGEDVVLTNAQLVNPINLPNIPDNAKMAKIYVNSADVNAGIRFFENKTPSASSGKILYAGGWYEFYGSLRTAKVIRLSDVASLELIVSYFG